MKESSTYQVILEEGRMEGRNEGALTEAKKMLRLLGESAYGPPDARIAARIEPLNDLAELEDVLKHIRTAATWQELFDRPALGPQKKRRR